LAEEKQTRDGKNQKQQQQGGENYTRFYTGKKMQQMIFLYISGA
jgi:hypothetical protein